MAAEREQGQVVVSVSDDGVGMSQRTIAPRI